MLEKRIRREDLKSKIVSADEAAKLISDGMVVATSGFTPSGYPKAVPLALAKRAENGEEIGITLLTGASVGDELDGALGRAGVIKRRFPYQTHKDIRNGINESKIMYQDMHLSHLPQYMEAGVFGDIDVAIVEAVAITEDGGIVPSTSVGIASNAVKLAKKVIIEVNTSQPLALEGMHDIYIPEKPPYRKPIPIEKSGDRIGTTYIPCDLDKIAAIVVTDITDKVRPLGSIDDKSKAISKHIIEFLQKEVEDGRLPENLLPLQSGVGSVANAVLGGLVDSPFENLTCYTEVLQDSMLDLIDSGKASVISTTAITPSEDGLKRLHDNIEKYANHIVLRPQEISNNPEVARRLGVISMNTAIEIDMYGHVNSTNIMGSRMMNGIGGSGDFTRNAFLSIYTTVSTAKGGDISSIVPKVSHVDHTEHDVMVVVTEQGLADLRGKSPVEKARLIINNCAHPDYRDKLNEYLDNSLKTAPKHQPHNIGAALNWHETFINTGSMKNL